MSTICARHECALPVAGVNDGSGYRYGGGGTVYCSLACKRDDQTAVRTYAGMLALGASTYPFDASVIQSRHDVAVVALASVAPNASAGGGETW